MRRKSWMSSSLINYNKNEEAKKSQTQFKFFVFHVKRPTLQKAEGGPPSVNM